jgi:hypothetical protein
MIILTGRTGKLRPHPLAPEKLRKILRQPVKNVA